MLTSTAIKYEVRTSTSSDFLSAKELEELFFLLKDYGVKNYAVQELISPQGKGVQDWKPFQPEEIQHLQDLGNRLFKVFKWRAAALL